METGQSTKKTENTKQTHSNKTNTEKPPKPPKANNTPKQKIDLPDNKLCKNKPTSPVKQKSTAPVETKEKKKTKLKRFIQEESDAAAFPPGKMADSDDVAIPKKHQPPIKSDANPFSALEDMEEDVQEEDKNFWSDKDPPDSWADQFDSEFG